MNEEVFKPGIISRIARKLDNSELDIGRTNQRLLPNNLKLRYTQEIIDAVLSAFLESMEDVLADGDSIKLNGYIHIKPEYCKAKKGMNVYKKTRVIIPARHRPKIKAGSRLIEACSKLDR